MAACLIYAPLCAAISDFQTMHCDGHWVFLTWARKETAALPLAFAFELRGRRCSCGARMPPKLSNIRNPCSH